ncbi:MAG: hypothetical protein AcusKO_06200 [Acuticoccus sp.]
MLDRLGPENVARWVSAALRLMAVALPTAVAGWWAFADDGTIVAAAPGFVAPADGAVRLAGAALSLLPALVGSIACWRAAAGFAGFARGAFFAPATIAAFRGAARWLLVGVVVKIASGAALSVALTLLDGAPGGTLSVAFGSGEITDLLVAFGVYVTAAVLTRASALAHENAAFV